MSMLRLVIPLLVETETSEEQTVLTIWAAESLLSFYVEFPGFTGIFEQNGRERMIGGTFARGFTLSQVLLTPPKEEPGSLCPKAHLVGAWQLLPGVASGGPSTIPFSPHEK